MHRTVQAVGVHTSQVADSSEASVPRITSCSCCLSCGLQQYLISKMVHPASSTDGVQEVGLTELSAVNGGQPPSDTATVVF